jgi:hypothetical protein
MQLRLVATSRISGIRHRPQRTGDGGAFPLTIDSDDLLNDDGLRSGDHDERFRQVPSHFLAFRPGRYKTAGAVDASAAQWWIHGEWPLAVAEAHGFTDTNTNASAVSRSGDSK